MVMEPRYCLLLAGFFLLIGCGRIFQLSHSVMIPTSPEGNASGNPHAECPKTAGEWRRVLIMLVNDPSNSHGNWRGKSDKEVLDFLCINEDTKNISWVRTPSEIQALFWNVNSFSAPFKPNRLARIAFEEPERIKPLKLIIRDVMESMIPWWSLSAAFTEKGEDFVAYIIFVDSEMDSVFEPNNQPVDWGVNRTILDVIPDVVRGAGSRAGRNVIP